MPLLDLIVGYDCNLHCDYCTIGPAMRARALTTAQIAAALADGRRRGYDRVSFTGGEPTIRPDLLPLVRRARALGFQDVKVQSNGLLFGQGRNVERLVEAGVSLFHVSIHTHRADRYEAMVRRAGTWAAMVAGLERVVESGVHVVADVIVKTDTQALLTECIEWLHARGVDEVHLWFVSLTDNNASNVASMPRMTEAMVHMRAAFARGRELGMTVRSLHVPRCLLGDDHLHAWDPAIEGVLVVSPDATFELAQSKITGRVFVSACDGCPHRDACSGIRPDYLARYGDEEFARARGVSPTVRKHLPLADG